MTGNPIKQLSYEQLLELVLQQQAEIAWLRAEIELLKQRPPQSGAPFSKNKRKEKPNRPGRKPGQGSFQRREAPAPESYSAPPEEVAVTETACPACGGGAVSYTYQYDNLGQARENNAGRCQLLELRL